MDSISSSQDIAVEDPLFEGISDSFFDDVNIVEEDPLFEGIPDELFDDEDPLFEGISDKFFDEVTATATSPHRGPSFLSLPPEIRNMIYDLVFVSPAYIGTNGMTNSLFFKDALKWRNLDFAMSCRQVYIESANVFYAKNGFEFYYIRPFKAFLESIGIERRRLITKLNFNFLKGSPYVVLRYIRSCTNIQQLNISLRVMHPQGWWLYPVQNVKEFLFTNFNKLEFGEATGFRGAPDGKATGELTMAQRGRSALCSALKKAKHEDIYAQNG